MTATEQQRFVVKTVAARDRAEALLSGLIDAKQVTERELSRLRREDPMRLVKGRSAIDDAIASTRRMIDTLERSLREAEREMAEADRRHLTECAAGHGV